MLTSYASISQSSGSFIGSEEEGSEDEHAVEAIMVSVKGCSGDKSTLLDMLRDCKDLASILTEAIQARIIERGLLIKSVVSFECTAALLADIMDCYLSKGAFQFDTKRDI